MNVTEIVQGLSYKVACSITVTIFLAFGLFISVLGIPTILHQTANVTVRVRTSKIGRQIKKIRHLSIVLNDVQLNKWHVWQGDRFLIQNAIYIEIHKASNNASSSTS